MADNFTDWLYETLKNSPLGQRADANWEARQQGAPPVLPIPGIDWAGIDASRNPTYVEGGIIPPIGLQGSKVNRGEWSEFYQPPTTAPSQVAYRNRPNDIIRDIAPPPVQTASNYSALDTITPLDMDNFGLERQSFFAKPQTSAERAIGTTFMDHVAETAGTPRRSPALPRVPLPRPFFPSAQMAEAIAIGKAYKPSAKVQAALNAPAPPGSPGAPSGRGGGGLLGMLLGAFGGGSGGQGGGLASILSGGGPATGPQLASMQQAAQTAQDPALAAALAAGNKSYVPTNGDPTGVLGYGALMPTVAMNGNPIRNR